MNRARGPGAGVVGAILACAVLPACRVPPGRTPLWPGSQFSEADRSRAIRKAIAYIGQSAAVPANFEKNGSDYLFCFYSIADTAKDGALRAEALRLGREHAKRWAATQSVVHENTSADDVADQVFGWLAASLLGETDASVKPALQRAARRFSAADYLLFDPAKEPPPADIPARCRYDKVWNTRGATVCVKCGRPLTMRSRYDIWLDALIATYTGDRYGVPLGASYREVASWTPAMRPYPDRGRSSEENFIDTVYAVTHLIYTLNDYGRYHLKPAELPQELAFLHRNLSQAIALHDPETMGEFLDTLKSLGLGYEDGQIRTGTEYLLQTQRPDGTWSAPGEKDSYTLYHSAWTGIDGLKDCRWRGTRSGLPAELESRKRSAGARGGW